MKTNTGGNYRALGNTVPLLNFSSRAVVETSDIPVEARLAIILPVLNEAARLGPCLASLIAQTAEAVEILVVDGGSTDRTREIVERYRLGDRRVRLVDASPVSENWTGKAWGLQVGLRASSPDCEWILCTDADVHASPWLVRSLLSHAQRTGVSSFSLATRQKLSGPIEALIHPALLTTLVYRFGIPGNATRRVHKILANGQCFISRRDTLLKTEAFAAARSSLCEDITIARRLAECGEPVGFYESRGLVEVRMYHDWRETWNNWPRSLPMRDQYFGRHGWLGLFKVLLLQALPLPIFGLTFVFAGPSWMIVGSGALALLRMGVLCGTARAYRPRPWTYWLSPLLDMPVAVKLFISALSRRHTWRGRVYRRRPDGGFEAVGEPPPRKNKPPVSSLT